MHWLHTLRRWWGRSAPPPSDEDPYLRYYRIDLGPPRPGHESRPNWGIREEKIFTALVHEAAGPQPVLDYLREQAEIAFQVRDSEFLYESEYISGRGIDTDIGVTLIPATNLRWLPRRLRQTGWLYVSIGSPVDDPRFATLPGYELLPVRQYLP